MKFYQGTKNWILDTWDKRFINYLLTSINATRIAMFLIYPALFCFDKSRAMTFVSFFFKNSIIPLPFLPVSFWMTAFLFFQSHQYENSVLYFSPFFLFFEQFLKVDDMIIYIAYTFDFFFQYIAFFLLSFLVNNFRKN